MPPDSRRPFEPGGPPGPVGEEAAGFEIVLPGIPGTGTHYHLRVPDRGGPGAALAGGTTSRALLVLLLRTDSPVDAAVETRRALGERRIEASILDPATSGGCGGEAGHRPAGSRLRPPPASRVVRFAVDAAGLADARAVASRACGAAPEFEETLGGPPAGEVWVDLLLVGR